MMMGAGFVAQVTARWRLSFDGKGDLRWSMRWISNGEEL